MIGSNAFTHYGIACDWTSVITCKMPYTQRTIELYFIDKSCWNECDWMEFAYIDTNQSNKVNIEWIGIVKT